jgi:tetratricopeptide (TPR) repeat protein
MNKDLLKYYLGRLFKRSDLSRQCLEVKRALLREASDDSSRLTSVLEILDGRDEIGADTVEWLRRGIRGHYGGENYVLDVSRQEETDFWMELAARYPKSATLSFVAAGSLFPSEGALRMFLKSFELNPELVWELGGDVSEAFAESEHAAHCELFRLRSDLEAGNTEEALETVEQFREMFGHDEQALRKLEHTLAIYSDNC